MAEVYQGNPCRKYGHTERYVSNNNCFMCSQIKQKIYYNENKEEILEKIRTYQENHKEELLQYRKDNSEKKNKYCKIRYYRDVEESRKRAREKYNPSQRREYRRDNQEKIRASSRIWRKKNPKIGAYHAANYRAMVKQQTPPWADLDKIKEIYMNCPDGYEVDHIHPLSKGGLHVDYNLQYLTISENRSKGNKLKSFLL